MGEGSSTPSFRMRRLALQGQRAEALHLRMDQLAVRGMTDAVRAQVEGGLARGSARYRIDERVLILRRQLALEQGDAGQLVEALEGTDAVAQRVAALHHPGQCIAGQVDAHAVAARVH